MELWEATAYLTNFVQQETLGVFSSAPDEACEDRCNVPHTTRPGEEEDDGTDE